MREILFRGRRRDGTWAFGLPSYALEGGGLAYIEFQEEDLMEQFRRVDPETIDQYTGLTDKHGTKIFEGDIVEYHETVAVVVFDTAMFYVKRKDGSFAFDFFAISDSEQVDGLEVIGNIHDNPELLEVE